MGILTGLFFVCLLLLLFLCVANKSGCNSNSEPVCEGEVVCGGDGWVCEGDYVLDGTDTKRYYPSSLGDTSSISGGIIKSYEEAADKCAELGDACGTFYFDPYTWGGTMYYSPSLSHLSDMGNTSIISGYRIHSTDKDENIFLRKYNEDHTPIFNVFSQSNKAVYNFDNITNNNVEDCEALCNTEKTCVNSMDGMCNAEPTGCYGYTFDPSNGVCTVYTAKKTEPFLEKYLKND